VVGDCKERELGPEDSEAMLKKKGKIWTRKYPEQSGRHSAEGGLQTPAQRPDAPTAWFCK